jgi:hypothetical protein
VRDTFILDDDDPCDNGPGGPNRLRLRLQQGGLGVLIVTTCVVLGWQASWWLVPGYLLLMTWLLAGADVRTTAVTDRAPAPSGCEAGAAPGEQPSTEIRTTASEAQAGTETATVVKKRRTRKPRAKPSVPEPVEARWVQVAPGKFVRVEKPPVSGEDHQVVPIPSETEAPSEALPDLLDIEPQPEAMPRADTGASAGTEPLLEPRRSEEGVQVEDPASSPATGAITDGAAERSTGALASRQGRVRLAARELRAARSWGSRTWSQAHARRAGRTRARSRRARESRARAKWSRGRRTRSPPGLSATHQPRRRGRDRRGELRLG